MNYVYCFKNYYDEIIYVGKTKNIKNRMRQHFMEGHLPEDCYQQVARVFYAETGISKYDTEIIETLLIDQFKPIYNTDKKYPEHFDRTNFQVPDLKWRELFLLYSEHDFEVRFQKPTLTVYDEKQPLLERCRAIISYNILKLKSREGFYEYYLDGVFTQHPNLKNDIIHLYTRAMNVIVPFESDVDQPISDIYDEYFITYTAIDPQKIKLPDLSCDNFLLLEKIGFIFKIHSNLYAIPLHSAANMHLIGKRFDRMH